MKTGGISPGTSKIPDAGKNVQLGLGFFQQPAKAPLAICRPTVRAGRRAAHGLSESGGAGCDKVQRGGPMIRCGTFFAENSFEPIGDPADVKRPLGIKSPVRP